MFLTLHTQISFHFNSNRYRLKSHHLRQFIRFQEPQRHYTTFSIYATVNRLWCASSKSHNFMAQMHLHKGSWWHWYHECLYIILMAICSVLFQIFHSEQKWWINWSTWGLDILTFSLSFGRALFYACAKKQFTAVSPQWPASFRRNSSCLPQVTDAWRLHGNSIVFFCLWYIWSICVCYQDGLGSALLIFVHYCLFFNIKHI